MVKETDILEVIVEKGHILQRLVFVKEQSETRRKNLSKALRGLSKGWCFSLFQKIRRKIPRIVSINGKIYTKKI